MPATPALDPATLPMLRRLAAFQADGADLLVTVVGSHPEPDEELVDLSLGLSHGAHLLNFALINHAAAPRRRRTGGLIGWLGRLGRSA